MAIWIRSSQVARPEMANEEEHDINEFAKQFIWMNLKNEIVLGKDQQDNCKP